MKQNNPHSEEEFIQSIPNLTPPFRRDSIAFAKKRVLDRVNESESSSERATTYGWIYKAAGIVLAIGVASILLHFQNQTITNAGEKTLVYELPCKTKLSLNPGAELSYNRLTYAFMRKVSVRGSTFFDVSPGSPFTAYSPHCNVKVFGTTFDLWAGESKSFVHCHSGMVEVAVDGEVSNLKGSEFVRITEGIIGSKQRYSIPNFEARSNQSELRFENAPVEFVIANLESAQMIGIDCSLDSSLRYTGSLDITAGVDHCLNVFCKPFGASFEHIDSSHIRIYP